MVQLVLGQSYLFAQQASGYYIRKRKNYILEEADVCCCRKISPPCWKLVWCSMQLVLIKFNKVVHGSLNSVHWSQITELASDLDLVDLRAPVINYLKGLSQLRDRKIRREALKCTLLKDELYRRTIEV
jgi:hypothetical protein